VLGAYDHRRHQFTSEAELQKVAANLTATLERQHRMFEGLAALRKRGVVMHAGAERPHVSGTQLTLQVLALAPHPPPRDCSRRSASPRTFRWKRVGRGWIECSAPGTYCLDSLWLSVSSP
jgi:hypothetical protein